MSNRFRRTQPILAILGVLALLVVGIAYVFSSSFYELDVAEPEVDVILPAPPG